MQTHRNAVVKNEYDLILEFARAVVPSNWNIYWNWSKKEMKKGRHTCNIQLRADPNHNDLEDDHLAMVHNLSWLDGVMFTEIYLDTYRFYAMEETILHELAHVAEQRYIMLKEGGFRQENASIYGKFCRRSDGKKAGKSHVVFPFIDKYEDHGELFERCLSAFHSRAKRKGKTLDLAKLFALPR